MKKKRLVIFYIFVILLVVGCQSQSVSPTASISSDNSNTALPLLDVDEIALGQMVYVEHCASCHGANLEGEENWKMPNEDGSFKAPPHDKTGHTWHHADSLLLDSMRAGGARLTGTMAGKSNMPAFGEILTEAEMKAVLTYIKSTWPDNIRSTQWQQTQQSP